MSFGSWRRWKDLWWGGGVDEGNLATKSPHGLRMRRAERAEAGCDHLQEGLARALARVHGWAKGNVKWL